MTAEPEVEGTYLFGLDDSRRGYPLNRLCASLVTAESRESFLGDEAAYCDRFALSPDQRAAVLARDWVAMLDLGGSIFYVFKLAQVDKKSMQYLCGVFTGMATEQFTAALRAGGRILG
jgi:protocatechuate 4,5-dioxygenase, alpha chain